MIVCRLKETGFIIEGQSRARAGTLIQNAVNCGYKIEDVEELEMSDADFDLTIKSQNIPSKEQLLQTSQREIYEIHIADLSKMVIELKQKVEALTGEKCATDTAPLEAKLAECDALKAEISKDSPAGPQIALEP